MIRNQLVSLLKMGEVAKSIKKEIGTKRFKTDLEIKNYVRKRILENKHYIEAFPTLVAPDDIISHLAPHSDQIIDLTQKLMYTVDFGLEDVRYGTIIDNSVTVCNHPQLVPYIKAYEAITTKIELKLQKILSETSKISYKTLTKTIHEEVSTHPSLYIVPWCCGHTIGKGKLHDSTLAMSLDSNWPAPKKDAYSYLREGSLFTCEPHLLILDCPTDLKDTDLKNFTINSTKSSYLSNKIAYSCLPGNILQDVSTKRFYGSDDITITPENRKRYKGICAYKSNYLSFFIENTYTIYKNKLIRIT